MVSLAGSRNTLGGSVQLGRRDRARRLGKRAGILYHGQLLSISGGDRVSLILRGREL